MGLTLLEIQGLTASLAANGRVPSTVTPPAATGTVTGIIPAAGATATAGSGFAYAHTNGTGVYVFTFTAAFAATPALTLAFFDAGASNDTGVITAQSASGFSVQTFQAGAGHDVGFTFVAQAVT